MVTWEALARTINKFREETARQHKSDRAKQAARAVKHAKERKNAET